MRRIVERVVAATRLGSLVASEARRDLETLARVAKADASPVTVADFAVQAVVLRALLGPQEQRGASSSSSTRGGEEEDDDDDDGEGLPRLAVAEEDGATFLALPDEARAEVRRRCGLVFPDLGKSDEDVATTLDWGRHAGGKGQAFFVVDPIDGTKGFVRGESYAVCVGVVGANGEGLVGCLGCPTLPPSESEVLRSARKPGTTGSLFVAVRNQGTRELALFAEDESASVAIPLSPRPVRDDVVKCVESYEASHKDPRLEHVKRTCNVTETVPIDSQVKYALMARGEADVYPRLARGDQFIWDVLPGAVVALEAGCSVTNSDGSPIDFAHGRTIGSTVVLCSRAGDAGAKLHAAMVAAASSPAADVVAGASSLRSPAKKPRT